MLRLFETSDGADHNAVVREITERIAARLRMELRPETERMSNAELRGYVRARSRALVRQEFQVADVSARFSIKGWHEHAARISERVVHIVVSSFAMGHIPAIPSPHISDISV